MLIYRLQGIEPWGRHIALGLAAITEPKLVISDLSRMECRVKPLREADTATLAKFDAFFAAPTVAYAVLSSRVFDRGAELRATRRLKTRDALHLAAALVAGCDEFWTNDRRLVRAADGRVRVV